MKIKKHSGQNGGFSIRGFQFLKNVTYASTNLLHLFSRSGLVFAAALLILFLAIELHPLLHLAGRRVLRV